MIDGMTRFTLEYGSSSGTVSRRVEYLPVPKWARDLGRRKHRSKKRNIEDKRDRNRFGVAITYPKLATCL